MSNEHRDADVVIIGAGPTGLMLAGDLAEAGVSTLVLESDAEPRSHPRAWGLQPRTQETLALRGVLDAIADGVASMSGTAFGGIGVDYTSLKTPFPRFLHAPQTRTEQVLRERALGAGAELRYGTTVRGVCQAGDSVTVTTEAGPVATRYAVGCDGGRSIVRKSAGIELIGTPALSTALFADVELADPSDAFSLRGAHSPEGMLMVLRRPPTMFRVIALHFRPPAAKEPDQITETDLHDAIQAIAGRDVEFTTIAWLSRFTDAALIAERYRHRRILLAGDAAHIHSPFGGQGLNLGVQDAANLSWRLARAVDGDPASLAGYELERKPVAESVLENTRVQTQLLSAQGAASPLRDAFTELATLPEGNRHLAQQLSGLSIRYQTDTEDDPFAGRFLPVDILRASDLRQLGTRLDPRQLTEIENHDRVLLVRSDGYVAESRPH